MGLPGYYYKFKKPNGTEFTYTGAVFEQDVEFTQYGATDCSFGDSADNGEYSYKIYGGGANQTYNAEPYDLKYYFGSEQFSLIKEIAKSGKTLAQILNYFVDLATTENNDDWKIVNSGTIPEITSKDTGFLSAASGTQYYQIPNVRCHYRSFDKTVSVAGASITFRMRSFEFHLQCNWGTWDSTNQKWNNVNSAGQDALRMNLTDHNTAATQDAINAFCNVADKITLAMGPGSSISSHKFVSYAKNRTSYYFRGRNISEFAKTNLMWRNDITLGNSGKLGSNNWYDGSEVDPEDPWDTPEPYPPTPPNPPTPDPPVPVDPVDPIPEPEDPPIGGTDIGFMSVYSPDRSTLKHIAEQFWNPTALQAIKQYFTDPIDAIIGLSIVPVLPETRSPEAVVIGMYNTHVGAPVVTTEYATHNCGSVYIPKFFNSYLDYDPYTKYQLYLPYIGEVELNADEITSKTITIKYKCNVVTGDCVALVMIGNNVFGTFNGNFSRQVPITAANYGAIISSAVNVATTAATVGVGVIGSQLTGEAIAENAVKGSTKELTSSGAIRATGAEVAAMNTAASGTASLVNNVMSAKATYKKSGNVGQGAGQISVRTPFITITRPNLTLPENIDQASQSSLRRYVGYPSNKIGRLSSFHGLTVVEACKLSSQHATDGEIAEALEIMKGGVIL